MTPKERKVVFTLIGVMFLIMVTVIIIKSSKNGKANDTAQSKQNAELQGMSSFMQGIVENNVNESSTDNDEGTTNNITNDENNTATDNNVNNNENNGTETNITTPNVKKYKDLVITNIEYKDENGGKKIVANITNDGSTNFISEVAKLIIITNTGEQIQSVITIPSIDIGATNQLEHILDEDASNIIDFNIEEI